MKLSSIETNQSLTSLQAEPEQKTDEPNPTKARQSDTQLQLSAHNANPEILIAMEVMLVSKLEEAAKACEIKDELVKNLQHKLDEAKEVSACVLMSVDG